MPPFQSRQIALARQFALGFLLAFTPSLAQAASDAEVRAAMIYNIARFVQWPQTATQQERFDICTLGDNDVSGALGSLAGKELNGAPAVVRAVQRDVDLSGCHMLYIGVDEVTRMATLVKPLADNHVSTLTISDAPSFLALGGMVQLVVLNDRHRFRINRELAEKANLGINAKLLQLALPGVD